MLVATWPASEEFENPYMRWWRVFEALTHMSITGELTEKHDGSVYGSSLLSAMPQGEEMGWRLSSGAFIAFGTASRVSKPRGLPTVPTRHPRPSGLQTLV